MLKRLRGRGVCVAALGIAAILIGSTTALLAACGPFTDVTADAFCPFVTGSPF